MTNINWFDEAKKYQDELLKDLQGWIQIPSVKEASDNLKEYPVGANNRKALDYFLQLANRDGFTTKNVANIAGHLEYGTGEQLFGVLGHSDVVPVGDGWSHDPFGGDIVDGFMYGRGTQDDKGPMMASFYAIKMLRDLKLPISQRIRLINGTDEESGFSCMKRYFETEEMPSLGFSPDANFPLIYGEKGMFNFEIHVEEKQGELIAFEAGQKLNMVPDNAEATVKLDRDLTEPFQQYIEKKDTIGNIVKNSDETQTLIIEGKSVHGMQPENGINAAYLLAEFLYDEGVKSDFLATLYALLLNETDGAKLGIAHDGEMGGLTVNPGMFTTNGQTFIISVNLRHSQEWNQDAGIQKIEQTIQENNAICKHLSVKTPLYVAPEDPFIKTLHDVYQRQTGDTETPILTTGGGTYASVMEKGVAYGMLFKGTEDRMHQVDERVPVEDLIKAVAIYAEAIYELTK